ncbi:MAG: hypothetical protein WC705_03010 [Candidatus Paceibacterota bacterium]|jgi:hypothetical protein
MSKNILIIILAVIVVGGGAYFIISNFSNPSNQDQIQNQADDFNKIETAAKNSAYVIERDSFDLQNGSSSQPSGTETKVFNVTSGDINQDGKADAVVILFQNSGGTGTFFYVSAITNSKNAYQPAANSVFLGDRISPQTVEIKQGQIIVNYADRYPWESYAATPSVGKSKYLTFENGLLKEKELPKLSLDEARRLILDKYYKDCLPVDCPTSVNVDVSDGVDGVWYVQAIFNGVKDDSVDSQKKIHSVNLVSAPSETWALGQVLVSQQRCQQGRGHQEFSEELCL